MRWIVWVSLVGCGSVGAAPIAAATIGPDASDDARGGIGSSEAGNDASGSDSGGDADAGADTRIDVDAGAGTLTGTGGPCDADSDCPFTWPWCRGGHCAVEGCVASTPGGDPTYHCMTDLGGECVKETSGFTMLVCEVRR